MKPVLIQSLIKKRRREQSLPDPEPSDMQKQRDQLFVAILVILALIVVGSIAIAA